MDLGNPVWYAITSIFCALVLLFGLALLWVRATNIERHMLVGGLTILTAVIAISVLANLPEGSRGGPVLVSTALLALVGYAVGRVVDAILGERDSTTESVESTLGADLAD